MWRIPMRGRRGLEKEGGGVSKLERKVKEKRQ
jgi:hypothetical protein